MEKTECKCVCKTQAEEAKANVCEYTERICLNCYYYDSRYHNGFCDYHRTDTSASNSCGDFKYR